MRVVLILISCLLLSGCAWHEGPVDLIRLERYVRNEANGLVRSRSANGITTTVRLVPPELAVLRDLRYGRIDTTTQTLSGRILEQERQLCVVVNLAPDTLHYKGDVMRAGVRTIPELKEQALLLNFNWEDMAELKCGGNTYRPVISSLENTYGLSKDRNVVLVFVPEQGSDNSFYTSDELELTIRDQVLGTGIQHFKFTREALRKVPSPIV
jgi:hypothetical protein